MSIDNRSKFETRENIVFLQTLRSQNTTERNGCRR